MGFPGESSQKFWGTNFRLQLINFTQNLDFEVLWFRRRTSKMKVEKKKKPHRDQKRVGMDIF